VPEPKLRFEQEHLDALQRMRVLEPYYRWMLDLMRPYLGQRVLDAGCGIGNFTALLSEVATYVLATDLSAQNVAVMQERFRHTPAVDVLQLDLEGNLAALATQRLDTIVCLDVLEHMEDDVMVLRNLRAVLPAGGYLIAKVPACPWLYGSVDRASSHYRRYSRSDLRARAVQAGWTPVQVIYANIFGIAPYWLKNRVGKRQTNFSRTFSPRQLQWLRRIIPWLQWCDRLLGPPIGQSALLIAR
jgi:SAM-dependent methyltransferase